VGLFNKVTFDKERLAEELIINERLGLLFDLLIDYQHEIEIEIVNSKAQNAMVKGRTFFQR